MSNDNRHEKNRSKVRESRFTDKNGFEFKIPDDMFVTFQISTGHKYQDEVCSRMKMFQMNGKRMIIAALHEPEEVLPTITAANIIANHITKQDTELAVMFDGCKKDAEGSEMDGRTIGHLKIRIVGTDENYPTVNKYFTTVRALACDIDRNDLEGSLNNVLEQLKDDDELGKYIRDNKDELVSEIGRIIRNQTDDDDDDDDMEWKVTVGLKLMRDGKSAEYASDVTGVNASILKAAMKATAKM